MVFFFIISGYTLSYSYADKIQNNNFCTRKLLCRQIRKIYPLHLITTIFWIIITIYIWNEFDIGKVMLSLTLLQSWTMNMNYYYTLNGVSWFLSDIIFCYATFYTLYKNLNRIRKKTWEKITIPIIFITYITIASQLSPQQTNDILYIFPLTRIIDFSIGIILYQTLQSKRTMPTILNFFAKHNWLRTLCEILAIILLISSYFIYQELPPWLRCAALFWPVLIITIAVAIINNGQNTLLNKILENKKIFLLGNLSMTIFLTHPTIIFITDVIIKHSNITITTNTANIAKIVAIVISAYLIQTLLKATKKRT